MPRAPLVALALASAFSLCGITLGLEPMPLNPFDTIDSIHVTIFVGEPIGSAQGERLFARDVARSGRFAEQLKARIEATLRDHGYKPVEDADDVLAVGIWGHQVPRADGQIDNVFFIELSAVDTDWNPSARADCERDLHQDSRAVGIASDPNLEQVLTSESMRLLLELLP